MQPVTAHWQPKSHQPRSHWQPNSLSSSSEAPFAPTIATNGGGIEVEGARGSTSRRISDETQREGADAALAVGQSLGKYEIRRKLGHGGQAQTFLAYDPDLRRLVVIKYYHSVRSEAEQEVVLREGRALARIRSPYVAQCFGAERHEGVVYLVLEYIPGQTLAERLLVRPFDVTAALRLTRQLAEGVAAIHACGLLHLDLKPANVLLGEDERPRIVDFGLAAAVGSDRLRQISGTPAYMAPEQARGEVERIDPRTDLFGLGAVLYELLTGQPPYRGESQHSVWSQARRGDIVPPVERRADLSAEVNALCLRCLAKEVGGRWNSATELAAKLDELTAPRRKGFELLLKLGCLKLHLSIGISLAALMICLFGVPQWNSDTRSMSGGDPLAFNLPAASGPVETSESPWNASLAMSANQTTDPSDRSSEPRDGRPDLATFAQSVESALAEDLRPSEKQTGTRLMGRRSAPDASELFLKRLAFRDLAVEIEPIAPTQADAEGWRLPADQPLRFQLRVPQACYAEVWGEDQSGAVTQLFPNGYESDARLDAEVARPLPGVDERGAVRYSFPHAAEQPWKRLIVRLSDERPEPIEASVEFPRWTTSDEREAWFARFTPPAESRTPGPALDRKVRRGEYVIPIRTGASSEEAQTPRP